jgi:hypothetical protein
MKASRIVNVDVRTFDELLKDAPAYRPKYAILKNATPKEIIDFADKHERTFVFTFVTVPAPDAFDYNELLTEENVRMYVIQPFCVDCFLNQDEVIQQYIKAMFGEDFENADLVTE